MPSTRILYVDATAGASGDMILGALADLGVPLAAIRRAVETLPLRGWRLSSRKVRRAGLAGRKVDVTVSGKQPERGWRDIRKIVEGGKLPPSVRERALAIFRRLVEAEAEVHGISPERVHLHEVGAVDAIVDVVGACAGIAVLDPDRIVASPLVTGFGTVRCEHGLYPVPAPATALLARGVPVSGGDLEGERLTPTGAAILTTLANAWGPLPALRPTAVGYGAGSREIPGAANLLRMVLGEADGPGAVVLPRHEVVAVDLTLDDASPQTLAYASERLFETGALEVYTAPIHMKKGRTGHHLTILCRPEDLDRVAAVVFRETTTLGLRYRREGRIELDRRVDTVKTRYGAVRVKVGFLEGRPVQAWPEYEDCAALARRGGVPLKEIQREALEVHRSAKEPQGRPTRRRRGSR